ncbi:MAG TPA: gamma-glutamyltransferase [Acidobacteriota bacterium]|nr:gamma-glutamyltransferase [Acidobacteriota bacterium]
MTARRIALEREKVRAPIWLLGLVITTATVAAAPALPTAPTVAPNGMVASPEPFATDAGVAILEAGGNAFDATAAIHFALAVTYPTAGNIGGGGFLVGLPAEAEPFALDFREAAPAAATGDMYLDDNGEMVAGLSTRTHKAVGVPGSIDGMLKLVERYGNLTRQQVLAPAIALARNGFPASYRLSRSLRRSDKLRQFPATVAALGLGGDGPSMGTVLVQSDLASTLETVSREGRAGFYSGRVADLIVADMQAYEGLVTHADLDAYSAIWRAPLTFTHGEYEWITHPVPSSGGMTIAQTLGLLHLPTMKAAGYHSSKAISMITEAQRLAFADRNFWLGDPGFFDVPVARLTSPRYIERRRRLLPTDGLAGDSAGVAHGPAESEETTHYTVVDRWGNVAAVTTTLNSGYGMGAVATGAGFLWNNQMDNFSAKPGVPNQYGMLGAEANAIEPGKRPLSSMTPSIIRRGGEFFMTMGSPGGPTIINTVLQIYLNVTVWGMDIQSAIDAERIHSQWLPDLIYHERFAISADTQADLWRMGYELRERGAIGMAAGIMRTPEGYLAGHADRRGAGTAKGH